MNGIVARIRMEGDAIFPVPYEIVKSLSTEKDVVVAVFPYDTPEREKIRLELKIRKYYGFENCKFIKSKIIGQRQSSTIALVSARCIHEKISDPDCPPPDLEISPIWQQERFGMSAEDALDLLTMDGKTAIVFSKIRHELFNSLKRLKLQINPNKNQQFKRLQESIDLLTKELECERKSYYVDIAEQIAHHLQNNFPVNAWVEKDYIEPVVSFEADIDDPVEAKNISEALEEALNSIDPIEAGELLSKQQLAYNECFWPTFINTTKV